MATIAWVITHPARDTRSRPQPGLPSGTRRVSTTKNAASSTAPSTASSAAAYSWPVCARTTWARCCVSLVQLGIQRDQRKSGGPGQHAGHRCGHPPADPGPVGGQPLTVLGGRPDVCSHCRFSLPDYPPHTPPGRAVAWSGTGLRRDGMHAKTPEGPALSGTAPASAGSRSPHRYSSPTRSDPVRRRRPRPAPVTRLIHVPSPAGFTGIDALRSGRSPARDADPGKSVAAGVCAGQGPDDPFSPGRYRPARHAQVAVGPALAMARCDQHACGPHETHTMAPVTALAGGVTRSRGRPAGPRWPSVPARRSRAPVWAADCLPGQRAGRVPGMAVRAPGLDNAGTGPVRAVLVATRGLRAAGGDAAVMAEQGTSELAGLLRQLRAGAD